MMCRRKLCHINYIRELAGVNHVGIGSDYDGVDRTPEGLEDVSKYPKLFDHLAESEEPRWTVEDLEKLAGLNLIRVFKKVEEVSHELKKEPPYEMQLTDRKNKPIECYSD